ncbi:hypothetical protein VULLAG_LOCUS13479 [Vulpes lagopus]
MYTRFLAQDNTEWEIRCHQGWAYVRHQASVPQADITPSRGQTCRMLRRQRGVLSVVEDNQDRRSALKQLTI